MRNGNLLGCLWFFIMACGFLGSFILLLLKLLRFDLSWIAVFVPLIAALALTGLVIMIAVLLIEGDDDEEREG